MKKVKAESLVAVHTHTHTHTDNLKNKGITLIALVVTIVVLLILAGVSISFIFGENGLITKAKYAVFVNEMTAIEEKINVWEAGEVTKQNYEDTQNKIPTNGLYSASELEKTSRLTGEVGYYRVWNVSEVKPDIDVYSDDETFNNTFESELVFYPAGLQDLYYLNNEELGISKNKKYLIDASNGIIYSTTGMKLNGVQCYSLNMAKMISDGNNEKPEFSSIEVSGSAGNLAGNVSRKYLTDEDGNYILDENGNKIENPDYNPYGFQIFTNDRTENLYKLYNDGTLYGKGIKGTQLNTSVSDMEEINPAKFSEFSIPSEVSNYKKIITGHSTVYFIDNQNYLWALGNNDGNKLGLTQEQQIEFTGRNIVKLNVNNKKVDMCWDLGSVLFVRTTDNELYAMGDSSSSKNYLFGNNSQEELKQFTKIEFPKVDKISYIIYCRNGGVKKGAIIACSDNTFYAAGEYAADYNGVGNSGAYKLFNPIFNGYNYKWDENSNQYVQNEYDASADIDQDIEKIGTFSEPGCFILKKDKTLWEVGWNTICQEIKGDSKIQQFPAETIGSNVRDFICTSYSVAIIKEDGTVWGSCIYKNHVGLSSNSAIISEQIVLPQGLQKSGIKEASSFGDGVYYLANDGKMYGSTGGEENYLGMSESPSNIVEIKSHPEINSLFGVADNDIRQRTTRAVLLKGKNGKIYSIGNSSILFRDNILQKQWKKVTNLKVQKVKTGENKSLAIIDENNNLYVCGNDARMLGLDISTQQKINNLVKVDDANINGKVKDVNFTNCTMSVLTTDGNLYVTGRFSSDGNSQGWPNGGFPGWSEKIDNYKLVKIDIEKVSMISTIEKDQIAIANNKIYTWGCNYYGAYYQASLTPVVSKFNNIVDATNVKQIFNSRPASIVLMKDGSVYIDGGYYGVSQSYTGIGRGKAQLENVSSLFNGKKISKFSNSLQVAMFLTDDGEVYGYGQRNILGINNTSGSITDQIQKLPIGSTGEKVSQIVVGNRYAIAITNTGKVYGTGSNMYGILGRWIGIDRKSPNSRYKTAFEWVECPELEI